MASSTTLRVINYRLTTTPVKQLPYLVDFLASSLGECGDILSASPRQKNGQPEADNALQVHKLKTRVASLLQDRNIEGRWSAVILIKTLVEAGQWEILRESEPWVRGLINILAVSRIDFLPEYARYR
jgi:pre-rRNA-processing protein RIX1